LTALVDWDFAHLAHPISEFFHSFGDMHGLFEASHNLKEDEMLLRQYQLNGFPIELPTTQPDASKRTEPDQPAKVDWQKAKMFDNALVEAGALKPSNIEGVVEFADLWWFTQEICPWWVLQDRKIEKLGPERVTKMRKSADDLLDAQLKVWGY
jgi:hypothetical protein